MTTPEIRDVVLRALATVAPEAKGASLAADASFRDQLDLDSMDMLNIVIAIHDALGIDIPEADYGRLSTLDDAVKYLAARLGGSH